MNYFDQSMNEIVFERRNKDYGAFFHRSNYQKNLLKALSISIGLFILSVVSPGIIKHLGLFKDKEPEIFDTVTYVLQAPPSINPFEPPKPPPPEIVKEETVAFEEMEAADKKDVLDPAPPTAEEIAKKEIDSKKADSSGNDSKNAHNAGKGSDDDKIWAPNTVQQLPEFTGGDEAYIRYMTDNKIYPEKEMEDGIEGETLVYYVVNKEGLVESVKVVRSSGNANLDAEALRLVKMQPRYRPGRMHGIPVKVGIAIKITFRQD